MLQPGTVIEVQLPGKQGAEQATVVSCNKRGSSCTVELASGEQATVNLTSTPHTVLREPAAQPAQQRQRQQQQQQQEQPNGTAGPSGGSSDDDEMGGADEEEEGDDDEEEAQLDAFRPEAAAALESFTAAVEDPGVFLQPSTQLADMARAAAKALYDYAAAADAAGQQQGQQAQQQGQQQGGQQGAGGASTGRTALLPELYVEGFDPEQIWLQLELAAEPALKRVKKLLRKVGPEPRLMDPDTEEALDDLLGGGGGSDEEGGSDSEGGSDLGLSEGEEDEDAELAPGGADLSGLDYEAMLAAGAAQHGCSSGEEDLGLDLDEDLEGDSEGGLSEEEEEEEEGQGAAGRKRKAAGQRQQQRAAAFEDQFFKVDDLERFLEQAEAEEGQEDEEEERQGDESEEDEFDEAAEGEPEGSDSDADMDALLANAIKLAGAKAKKRRVRFADEDEAEGEGEPAGGGSDDDEEEGDLGGMRPEEATYEDFFGPRRPGAPGASRGAAAAAAAAAGGGRGGKAAGRRGREEEEEEGESDEEELLLGSDEEMEDEEGGGLLGMLSDEEDEEELGLGQQRQQPSTHERRLQKIADKVRRLEEEAMAEKDWTMRGEVVAGQRPKNSALEVDLDFETSVKPPPQPTEESTKSLEELIKKRVAEGRFDDVVRIVPPPLETKKTTLELDDKKSSKGLGELYEEEYQQAVTGVSEDKDEPIRAAARAQFAALCAKLDALSHLAYRPKPAIEEVAVKVDVPAILMEEVAPQFVSEASMRAPEEVFAAASKGGAPRAEEELSREDRKRRRAQKKRASKKHRAAKDEERAARAVAKGGTAALVGRKSEAEELMARKMKKDKKGDKGAAAAATAPKMDYSKSAAVFAKIQEQRDGTAAGAGAGGKATGAAAAGPSAQRLKL